MVRLLMFIVFFMVIAFNFILDYLNASMLKSKPKEQQQFHSKQYHKILGLTGVFVILYLWEGSVIWTTLSMSVFFVIIWWVSDAFLYATYPHQSFWKKIGQVLKQVLIKRVLAIVLPLIFVLLFLEDGPWLPYLVMGGLTLLMIGIGYGVLFIVIIPSLFRLVPYLMPFDLQLKDVETGLDQRVFLMKSTKIRLPINALYTGFFKRGKILLSAALLSTLSSAQVKAIIAHEIGHHKQRHLWIRLVFLTIAIGLYIIAALLVYETALIQWMGLAPTLLSRVTVLLMIIYMFELVIELCFYTLSQYQEYAADRFAADSGFADSLAQALFLIDYHQPDPISHPLSRRVKFSHPPTKERIQRLKKLGRFGDDLNFDWTCDSKLPPKFELFNPPCKQENNPLD